jgi:RNA polymerase sigma-70 factor (ECF subfamily)
MDRMVFHDSASLSVRTRRVSDDRTLLKQAKAYDPAALGQLYDLYAPKMYAYIYRRVGNASLAEDLTSELFVRMLKALHNGSGWRDSFIGWLYRVAHNLVVDYYRRRPPVADPLLEDGPATTDSDPAVVADRSMANEELFRAIRQLTPDQQEVLVLRFGEGLTAREVGEIVGKTTGAVEALQRRGIAGLRRIMDGAVDDDS